MTATATRSAALVIAAAVLLGADAAARAGEQPAGARDRYEDALVLDRDARAAAERGDPDEAQTERRARRALVLYESVVRRFPTSGYCDNALLRGGDLARWLYTRSGRAADRAAATKYFAWLIREYPHSGLRMQAQAAARALTGAESEPPRGRAAAAPESPAPPARAVPTAVAVAAAAPATPGAAPSSDANMTGDAAPAAPRPMLRGIDRTMVDGVVRITLVLDRETRFAHEVIEGPRRAFVDLFGAGTGSDLQGAVLRYDGAAVRQVRVGRQANATRVVLDLDGTSSVSLFTLYNPFRIVIDAEPPVTGNLRAATAARPSSVPAQPSLSPDAVPAGAAGRPPSPLVVPAVLRDEVPAEARDENDVVPALALSGPAAEAPFDDLAPAHRAGVVPSGGAPAATEPAATAAPEPSSPKVPAPRRPARTATSAPNTTTRPAPAVVPSTATATPGLGVGLTAPVPSEPAANVGGRFSLSRQLGLGISRIVIDPGHGGHDPGTLTPGSSEAKLVLDVALRLERLLRQETGLEVVLTRRTDIFVPLEQRTAIANAEGADLFLSIHANASRDPKARGLETYYLSFASNPEAEAVAARENAASASDMHSLPSIVRAIALNNKLDESRDLAGAVQQTLARRLGQTNPGLRNRGVKKAPFVVLIGAGMPSVLAEIGFITNKQEAALVKTPAYRQKIAEALHAAILDYRRSLKRQTAVAAR